MASSIDPAALGSAAPVQALATGGRHDSADLRKFAELMGGVADKFMGGSPTRSTSGHSAGSNPVDLGQPLLSQLDPADRTNSMANAMVISAYGTAETSFALARIHVATSLGSAFNGALKQFLNRHDAYFGGA